LKIGKNLILGRIDGQPIEMLRQGVRLGYRELDELVSLSANRIADRVRRLIAEKTELRFSVKVNFSVLDFKVQALMCINGHEGASQDQC
jgi:Lrp/AsnC family leucine-responsive transcriptional regulator